MRLRARIGHALRRGVIVLCDYRMFVRSTNTLGEGKRHVKGDYR